ncbi:hypothetical protein MNBD_ALPHA08-9 [hydrothermal vent metagenome]|uniref:Cupin type-2 domain-containing protein n=1 Tax=hydrothermal vent metagenome TaxID=652676 RepID=A0A3B0RLX6_9ZZZZ
MKFAKTAMVAMVLSMLGTVATTSFAKESPTENKGISGEPLGLQTLQEQIPAMAGYVLRTRRVTLAPGGSVKTHSHADRPGFLYVLEGELAEYKDGVVKTFKPGDSWTETANTVHGVKNNTDKPAVAIVIDLVKAKE